MAISVCIATYNGGKYIGLQLKSILDQLAEQDEIIISDDNSTDNTLDEIRSFNDKRIRIYSNTYPVGVVGNFENALTKSKHDVIFLSDQDDIWQNNKVSTIMSALSRVDLVVSDCYFIDDKGLKNNNTSFFKVYRSGKGFFKNFIKNTYLGNCIAFKRNILKAVLPFPPELYKASRYNVYHDVWIGLLANCLYKVEFLPHKLSFFRRHANNASETGSNGKSTNPLYHKLKARSLLFLGIVFRVFKVLIQR